MRVAVIQWFDERLFPLHIDLADEVLVILTPLGEVVVEYTITRSLRRRGGFKKRGEDKQEGIKGNVTEIEDGETIKSHLIWKKGSYHFEILRVKQVPESAPAK